MAISVKPLVWRKPEDEPGLPEEVDLRADGVGGTYDIQTTDVAVLWHCDDPTEWSSFLNVQSAKNWAQMDHERRVLALIDEDSSDA